MSREDNPFAPPRIADRVVGVKSGRREDLKAVAVAQKALHGCIVLLFSYVCATLLLSHYPEAANHSLALVITEVAVVVYLVAMVSVFFIAVRAYTIGCAGYLLLGIATIVPVLGIMLMLMVWRKATRTLKENGHHVGLLGADLSRF